MHGGQSFGAIMVNAMANFGKFAEPSRRLLLAAVWIGTTAVVATTVGQAVAQQGGNLEHCRVLTDDAARLRCYEATTKPSPNAALQALGPGAGTWRLVRTPNPTGGPQAVSIMQTADIARSDL